jgi:hypothetical protein
MIYHRRDTRKEAVARWVEEGNHETPYVLSLFHLSPEFTEGFADAPRRIFITRSDLLLSTRPPVTS